MCWRTIDTGETLIINLLTHSSYLANQLGSCIWKVIIDQGSIQQLIDRVVAKFPESEATISDNVDLFLTKITDLCSQEADDINTLSEVDTEYPEVNNKVTDLWLERPSIS
jgi:hypothetical protein